MGRAVNFTPTWRTAGEAGQPDIGSGTLAGVVDDQTGTVSIALVFAEDTDGGEGYWILGIPPGTVDFMQMNPNGAAQGIDATDDNRPYVGIGILDRMNGRITVDMNDGVLWSASQPFVFAAGSRLDIIYQPRVAS